MSETETAPKVKTAKKTSWFSKAPARKSLGSILEPMKQIVADLKDFQETESAEVSARQDQIDALETQNEVSQGEIEHASELADKYEQLI